MKRRSPFNSEPFLAWTTLALKTSEMMFASAQVISHRTNRMAQAGAIPNARDRREFTLMGQEKIDAAGASIQAMAVRMITINQQFSVIAFRQLMQAATGMMTMLTAPTFALSGKRQAELAHNAMTDSVATASQVSDSLARLAHHGLKPIHARATSNAKRLAKI